MRNNALIQPKRKEKQQGIDKCGGKSMKEKKEGRTRATKGRREFETRDCEM